MIDGNEFDEALAALRAAIVKYSGFYQTLGRPDEALCNDECKRPTDNQILYAIGRRIAMAGQLEEMIVFAQRFGMLSQVRPLIELRESLIELNRGRHEWLLASRHTSGRPGAQPPSLNEARVHRIAVAMVERHMANGMQKTDAAREVAKALALAQKKVLAWHKSAGENPDKRRERAARKRLRTKAAVNPPPIPRQ